MKQFEAVSVGDGLHPMGREFVSLDYLEIESACRFPISLRDKFMRQAIRRGFSFSENDAVSLYFDTPRLDFFRNGRSLRTRLAGEAYCEKSFVVIERFPNQFALKSRHTEFQAAAHEIAGRMNKDGGMMNNVRYEIEGESSWPNDAHEFRVCDLPSARWRGSPRSVRDVAHKLVAEKRMRVRDVEDLVILPTLRTDVKRYRTHMYLDPETAYDFKDMWPLPKPPKEMRERGNYLCMELSLDVCVRRAPPRGATINDIMTSSGSDLSSFRNLKKVYLAENELIQKECGPRATNSDVVRGCINLNRAFHAFVRQNGYTYERTLSKLASGLAAHPDCGPDRPWHEAYEVGKLIAA